MMTSIVTGCGCAAAGANESSTAPIRARLRFASVTPRSGGHGFGAGRADRQPRVLDRQHLLFGAQIAVRYLVGEADRGFVALREALGRIDHLAAEADDCGVA